MDDSRVCFVLCVNDERRADECLLYLRHLRYPAGVRAEARLVRGAHSMAAGYNAAMRTSDAAIKVYLHQDTLVVNKELVGDLRAIFAGDAAIGAVGVIGCRALPASGVWWDSLRTCGRVLHACEPESYVDTHLKEPSGAVAEVEAVDGLLIATRVDVPWREDLFTGWHFYDVSQCLELRRRGRRVVIPNQEGGAWCVHCPTEKPLAPEYGDYRRRFLAEYGRDLHPDN